MVDATIRQQTALTVKALKADPRLAPLISAGRLLIEGAYYSLDTGKVTLSHPDNRHKHRDRACSERPSRHARVAC